MSEDDTRPMRARRVTVRRPDPSHMRTLERRLAFLDKRAARREATGREASQDKREASALRHVLELLKGV